MALQPPGPRVPAELQPVLQSFYDAISAMQNPQSPAQLPEIDTEAHLLDQAPAANWPNCAIIVTELNCIAISTDVAGTWTWKKADGSSL